MRVERLRGSLVRTGMAVAAIACVAAAPLRAQGLDHSAFDTLLKAHVVHGMVDYDAFARAPEFTRYLASVAAYDPSMLDRAGQIAFWIDAYNAYTIRLINDHHERRSIRNINRAFGVVKGYGPWQEKLAVVAGRRYSLDEIEQGILRGRFHEPRLHFALVCAAMGCPPLRSEAYVGSRLEEQLDDQAREFLLRSPGKNRIDVGTRTVYLSPIFVEFRDYIRDFGGTERSVAGYIARFFPPGPERTLLESGDFRVRKTHYDWALNSQGNTGGR